MICHSVIFGGSLSSSGLRDLRRPTSCERHIKLQESCLLFRCYQTFLDKLWSQAEYSLPAMHLLGKIPNLISSESYIDLTASIHTACFLNGKVSKKIFSTLELDVAPDIRNHDLDALVNKLF